ncbi:hypothetical protein D9615_001422 [Tricholomella constricta]|uniref:Pentatricopeptide repeat-containing protein n=1 Tax=Tricholomella constricta TaxID=117010 RepID=A0A8H5HK34_9AGAR|nr:hypothetical protein D9615_001422 [Tricholomella constricta]
MLLRAAAQRKSVVLLDFLAPSLLVRASSTLKSRPQPISLLTPEFSNCETADKVKKGLPLVHSTRGVSDSQVALYNQILVELRHASNKQNTHAVVKLWRQLEENRLLHFLQRSHVEVVSKLLARSFVSGELDSSHAPFVQDIALQAAASRSTDALNDLMVLLLKQHNPGAVIELYRRFTELLGGNDVWQENPEEGEWPSQSTGLVPDDHPRSRRIPYIPGRVHLLLAVTAAHAQRDAFQDALQTCLNTVVRFHHQSTGVFLGNFSHDPTLQDKVNLYVNRLDVARMVARPPSLSKQITKYSTAPSTKLLEALYQSIINGLSGSDAYIAPEPSKITPHQSVAMTESGWTSFLAAFLKCRRRDLASKIWTDMSDLGIRPGVSLWTALIDSYNSISAVDEAMASWNMMVGQGIKPEALTYRALISTLFNGRKYDEAVKVFQAFQKASLKDATSPHTLSVYNTVLHGLLSFNRESEAQALLKTMETQGPTPDLVSYNTLLAHFGRRGNFKALANLVSRMAALKMVGDVFSFSTILSALLRAGRDDAPELVIDIMRKQGVQPNVATYSAIIDHQIREQSEKNLEAIMRMLQKMEEDPNIQPNEVTYTSILAGLYRGQWLEPEKAKEWREEIVTRMKKRGVEFNMTTYHTLIKACLEYAQPEGLTNALAYYREMRNRKIPLIHTTWYIILLGLLRRGDWAVADEIVNDMYTSGHQPSGAVMDLVGKIRRRGS